MPEQYIGLQEVIKKQLEVTQTLLTEDQIEQINLNLIEALNKNKKFNIK
ncbi:YolD-like family protein [Priestia megaterium]|nr:YolD-like family protein [Priestia megaterium]